MSINITFSGFRELEAELNRLNAGRSLHRGRGLKRLGHPRDAQRYFCRSPCGSVD